MNEKSFVFVDIETNSGNGPRGRVIEVAALKVEGGLIVDRYQSLINPGQNIPHWITTLTGIENNDLAHAPYFSDIAHELYAFLHGSVFVAHNVLFDYSFLKREFTACDITFRPPLFCTVKMSRALFPEHRGHSLEKIITRHNLATKHRHRAYDDALVLYEYTQRAIELKGETAFIHNLHLQLKTKTLPPNVAEQTILDLPDEPGIYIFEDDAGMPLYVGKSVNIRSRVRSHFTNATSVAKEMRMSLQSHNVSYITTETEIEALLLESAKVKELQPVFNKLLRRKKTQHIVVKHHSETGYLNFTIESHDLSRYNNLANVYGVYTSKQKAKLSLETLSKTYQLCPKLLGLEKSTGTCFRYQLGLCRGACIGKERATHYNERVEFALERMKVESWPFASKIAIAISSVRSLVVDQWIPQGIYDHTSATFSELSHTFDMDTYKILRAFIRNNRSKVSLLGNTEIIFD